MMGPEQWRPVVGYEGFYEVSDRGRVRIVPRTVVAGPVTYTSRQHVLAQEWCGKTLTYRRVQLMAPTRCKRRVHVLVAEAFIGPRPDGMEVAHADDVGHHNWVGNLSYQTHVDNCADRDRRVYSAAELVGIGSADDVPW